MSGPKTVTVTFALAINVTLTVFTSPVGLDARIGSTGAFTAASPSISASVPANTSVPVAVTEPINRNGTGYRFISWGRCLASSSLPVRSLLPL